MAADDIAGEAHKTKQRNRAAGNAVDNRPPLERLYSAYRDLLAAGWRDGMYAPKDGSLIEIITLGSTGTFKASWHSFDHQPLDGCGSFFAEDGGDLYPTEVAVWRPIKN